MRSFHAPNAGICARRGQRSRTRYAFGLIDASPVRLTVSGENVRLPPRAALALGIAFHELGTNAVKYGALSTGLGAVDIVWTIEPGAKGDRLVLRWCETGGPPVTAPAIRSRIASSGSTINRVFARSDMKAASIARSLTLANFLR